MDSASNFLHFARDLLRQRVTIPGAKRLYLLDSQAIAGRNLPAPGGAAHGN
jgi:hypothetical protein